MFLRILISLLFISSFAGCKTYDYAVDKSKVNLPYRTYYYSDKDKKYDFYTVIYSHGGDIGTNYNYSDFNVNVAHMTYEHQHKYKGLYVSKLSFDNIENIKISIDFSSIKLAHRDSQGKLIKPLKVDSGEKDENKHTISYVVAYCPGDLSDYMTESIYVELTVDGKPLVIQATYPIEKILHYTFWDVLMGV